MQPLFPLGLGANLDIARNYGFEALPHPADGTYRNYVGIDERVIHRVHQYFKVLKFGYGRATDHACEDIRNGRLSREEAKALVRKHDLVGLEDDLVNSFIEHIGMSRERFQEVLDAFAITRSGDAPREGAWEIPGHLQD